MNRIVDALKYAIFGGGSYTQGQRRALLIEKALHVLQLRENAELSEVDRDAYDNALAELHAHISPQLIIEFACGSYLPALGPTAVGNWVHPILNDLKALLRRLSHEFVKVEDRIELQRQVIHRAHLAALDAGVFGQVNQTGDVRDGLANIIAHLAAQRDAAIGDRKLAEPRQTEAEAQGEQSA